MGEPNQKRKRAIQRLTELLLRRGSPRLQMIFFLAATGLAGFLTSALLHAAGLRTMAIRYPLAVGIAYLVFLALLSMFVAYHRVRHRQTSGESSGDKGPQGYSPAYWWGPDLLPSLPPATPRASGATAQKGHGNGNFALGGGDGDGVVAVVVVVIIIIAIVSATVASLLIVLEAPVLLAEVLVDGALVLGLARGIGPDLSPHWASGVIRRTVVPVIAVAVVFAVVGYGLEHLVPGATTMGEALHMAR